MLRDLAGVAPPGPETQAACEPVEPDPVSTGVGSAMPTTCPAAGRTARPSSPTHRIRARGVALAFLLAALAAAAPATAVEGELAEVVVTASFRPLPAPTPPRRGPGRGA